MRLRERVNQAVWLGAILALSQCGNSDVDEIDPAVRFTFPAEFTILSGLETIRVVANDNVEVVSVVFAVDGDEIEKQVTAPYVLLLNTAAYADCTTALGYAITAVAEDARGNQGSALRLYFMDNEGLPPLPVEMLPATGVTKHSASINWTRSIEYDFSHYSLRRDTTKMVTVLSDSVGQVNDAAITALTDFGIGVTPFGLDENTDYFYRVFVHDTAGAFARSDSVTTITTLLPQSISLSADSEPTKYTASLSWGLSSEDVAYYRLHRGPDTTLTALDSIARIAPGLAVFTDTNLTAETDYVYFIFVIDSAGYTNTFRSTATIALRTDSLDGPLLLPTAQSVDKYSARLQWQSVQEQEDSSWVTLFRSTSGSVDSTDSQIFRLSVPTSGLVHTDTGLRQATAYQYRMRHRDSRGNIKWSNLADLTTRSISEEWGGALGVTTQGKYDISLTWDRYNYLPDDFASYSLKQGGTEIFFTTVSTENSTIATGLSRSTTYSFEVTVSDTSGGSTSVSAQAATRDIFPAKLISVEPTILWFYELAWLPSSEPPTEFSKYTIVRSTNADENFTDTNDDNIPDCVAAGSCVELSAVIGTQQPSSGDTTLLYEDSDPNLITADLNALPIYNYAILTYDITGGYSPSNVVGDTLYTAPNPVTLSADTGATKTTIPLIWTRADWNNATLDNILFSRYEVWRNATSGQLPTDPESTYEYISQNDNIADLTFNDAGIGAGQQFAYRIILVDKVGRTAISNELIAATLPP